jgi:hypothetical protein
MQPRVDRLSEVNLPNGLTEQLWLGSNGLLKMSVE